MNLNNSLLLFAVIGVPVVWLVLTYNRFIDLRQHIRSAWAGIDVELKRRHDLIPQLVQVVKGYAEYESSTLKSLVEARGTAISPARAAAQEADITRDLKQLFLVAEAYPDLKADRRYGELQKELAITEDRIAAARRLYNGNVRDWNALRDGFPSMLVAKGFGLTDVPEFFELAGEGERVAPKVELR